MGNQPTKQIVNQTGKQKKYVHWKSAEVPSMPGRPILVPVSDQQPDVITIQWDKPQSDGGSPILGYIIEHRRIGATSWLRSVPTLIVKNETSISGLEPGWKYQFRAIAENIVGRSQPSILSDPLPVSLQMRNANTLPKFITELKDVNAIENERLEMRVRVFGNPQPEINWFKDGFEIFSSRRIKIVNENDFSMLIIHQVALTDEGEIKCTATNRAGHVVTKAKLIVEAPPKIRLPRNYEDGLIIEEDDVLKLKAGIAGQPFPAVIWSREGKVISEGSKFEISTTDKHTLLKISKVKRIDRGEYSIRAINKLGEDIASFLVTVTAKPRSPSKVQLVKSHGTSVTLSWKEPEDDGGCKIGSYIVEYFRVGWDVWLKATTTRQLQTTLKDLIEGSEYKFRVKAENPYGVSEPSPESDILYIKGLFNQALTETSLSISDNMKQITPSKTGRKTVDPPKSPIRANSPSVRTIKPELFESEQLNMEMSYGASDNIINNNLNNFKSSKTKEDRGTSPKPILKQRSPLPTPRKNHNNLHVEIETGQSTETQRTPSPKIEITPIEEKTKDESLLLRRSLSPKSKMQDNSTSTYPSEKVNSSPLSIKRNNSPNQSFNNRLKSSSPSTIISLTDQKIKERLEFEREKDEIKSNKIKNLHSEYSLKQNRNSNLQIQSEDSIKKSFEYLFTKMNGNNSKSLEKSQTNYGGKVEDLSQNLLNEANQNDSTDQQLSSDAEGGRHKDEVHTSNEYMLVFYPDGRTKDIEESESRNYYGGDNQGPPTLSYSFPNLSTLDEFSFQTNIRRSASSTELLYEKAMARFYEAVEMEEEKRDKIKTSHFREHLTIQKTTLQNLDSIAESRENLYSTQPSEKQTENLEDYSLKENNTYEGKQMFTDFKNTLNTLETKPKTDSSSTEIISPVNRRVLIEMTLNQHVTISNHNDEEIAGDDLNVKKEDVINSYRHFSDAEIEENTRKNSQFQDEKDIQLEYDSDYTASTASESESSMEYFKREVITRSTSGNIGRKKVTLSPVRYESEDDALASGQQIKPISSSDSIPKSILKKPTSAENVVNPISKVIPNNPLHSNVNINGNLNKISSEVSNNKISDLNCNVTVTSITNPNSKLFPNSNSNPNSDSKSYSNSNPNPKLTLNSSADNQQNLVSNFNLRPNANPNPNDANLNPNPNPNDYRRKSEDLKDNPKLSPLTKAKSASDKRLKGLKSFLTGGRKKSKKKNQHVEKTDTIKIDSDETKTNDGKNTEILKEEKKIVKPEPDEGALVVVDYYSSIVQELGHSKYKTPLYLDTAELKKQSEKAQLEENNFKHTNEIDDDEDLIYLQNKSKPRLSIVERMQTQHVRAEKSSHCIDNKIVTSLPETPENPISEPSFDETPATPTAVPKKIIKIKKIIKKRTRSKSRDSSKTRGTDIPNPLSPLIDSNDLNRLQALHQRNDITIAEEVSLLKQYTETEDKVENNQNEIVKYDPEEVSAEAQDNVHSAISYLTDLGLFVFACWVYLFKDAYMVLPILALMVYRRIGDAINRNLPSFLKKKPS